MRRVLPEQEAVLLAPIKASRVSDDGRGHSALEAWDVSAHLTRVFGFCGWEKHIVSLSLVVEEQETRPTRDGGERTGWSVTYLCTMRLRVLTADGWWENEDGSCGTAEMQPSKAAAHDLAMKDAISTALKRCAKDLGDQFGLSLYNKGSSGAVVQKLVGYEEDG